MSSEVIVRRISRCCVPLLGRERVSRVLLMLADEQREMTKMEEGNIAVAIGMKNVR